MSTIGIMTYYRAKNYGAVLQCFALQKVIETLDKQSEVIDYDCYSIRKQYSYKHFNECRTIMNYIQHNLTCLTRLRKNKKFNEFCLHIPHSSFCNKENISDISQKYDVIISGSDQVFNPVSQMDDSSYFLDFATTKHISTYAASMGSVDQFLSSKLDTKELLSRFEYLTFRENDATEFVRNSYGLEAETVLDPVLLLGRGQWLSICTIPKEKGYIFVYNLMNFVELKNFARECSEKLKLPIIYVNRNFIGDNLYRGCGKNASNLSPTEFLGFLANASLVITDSFHGTALSIKMHKDFFVRLNQKQNNTNSRITNLLTTCGLADRIISESTNICDFSLCDRFDDVETKLAPYVEKSIDILERICNSAS